LNPNSPTTCWLDAVAAEGPVVAKEGDAGSVVLKRKTGEFEVTVEKIKSW